MDRRLYAQLHEIEAGHWWFRGRRRILLAALDRVGAAARSILEVGCGAGTNLDLFRSRFPAADICGVDVEIDPLRFCRADRGWPVIQADAARLPFGSARFDLVAALDTIEHVEDDASALAELYRVCRPGGTLLLTVPAFAFLWGNVDELGHHYRRYRRAELLRKVEAAGFDVRLARFINFLLFPPIAAVRLAARLLPQRRGAGAALRSDFDVVKSGPLNTALARVFSAEAALLRWPLPFGVSLLCVGARGAAAPPRSGGAAP